MTMPDDFNPNLPEPPEEYEEEPECTDQLTVQCGACGGEGRKFRSRYGGNDPDVWDDGPCPACGGACYVEIESQLVTLDDISGVPPA